MRSWQCRDPSGCTAGSGPQARAKMGRATGRSRHALVLRRHGASRRAAMCRLSPKASWRLFVQSVEEKRERAPRAPAPCRVNAHARVHGSPLESGASRPFGEHAATTFHHNVKALVFSRPSQLWLSCLIKIPPRDLANAHRLQTAGCVVRAVFTGRATASQGSFRDRTIQRPDRESGTANRFAFFQVA